MTTYQVGQKNRNTSAAVFLAIFLYQCLESTWKKNVEIWNQLWSAHNFAMLLSPNHNIKFHFVWFLKILKVFAGMIGST